MLEAFNLACLDGEYGTKECVSIVDRATAVHLAILLDDRVTGVSHPALPKRLLIHMSIHQHALLVRGISRVHIDYEEGTPSLILKGRDCTTLNSLLLCKGTQVVTLAVQVSICLPLRVIQWGQTRYPHEL
jgi:hypothetical protein